MINHIAAKFAGLTYSAIPSETFNNKHQSLIEELRRDYPLSDVATMNNYRVDLTNEHIDTEKTSGIEVHMVSADRKLGLKIGNQGAVISVNGYVAFDELIAHFQLIVEKVHDVLDITHFSQVHLRNINLFPETEESNKFKDIRREGDWGRQQISALRDKKFVCSGAATKHVYLSEDYTRQLQISSGVVMGETHSYIPQEEWDIWKLRGGVPVAKEVNLLIDITGISHQAPVNEPEKINFLKEFNWDDIADQLTSLHDDINSVYRDIIIEE